MMDDSDLIAALVVFTLTALLYIFAPDLGNAVWLP
jgi:cell division protein FtsW (lipid II flippase)